MNFADSVAGLSVSGGGDGTSIQDDDVGALRGCRSAAAVEELAFDGGTIGLGGAAAELFDVEGGHCMVRIAKTGIGGEGTEAGRLGQFC